MSDAASEHPLTPEQVRAGKEALRIARGAAGFTLGLGLVGVQSLMRPDDLPPGRGRLAYRLAFGGLTAISGLLVTTDTSADPAADGLDPKMARRLGLATTVGLGAASAALFHPRVGANWWSDRLLSRIGVRYTRPVGAIIAMSVSAGFIVFSDRMVHAASHHVPILEAFPAVSGEADVDRDSEGAAD